ncbi:hypothetical protein Cgig2_032997 [Carnegiea gigantea]|uniref:DYW domain-containing protein n=1 Tax=Carnegiea gigantea TaxID=171969 RepID=A0A9Q1JUL1_9CARY|nr:hypothetical protein Cgig2_032997 [Carnegiea gigantea]
MVATATNLLSRPSVTQSPSSLSLSSSPSTSSLGYQALLRAGPRLKPLRQVHAYLIVTGAYRSRSLLTKLAALACTAKSIAYTRKLCLFIPDPDSYLFNTLIRISSKVGFQYDAVIFFNPCAQLGALELGSWVHDYVIDHGFEVNVNLGTALINMYSRCGNLRKAREVFDEMRYKNVVAWTAIISGYGIHGCGEEAVELYNLMKDYGTLPNEITFVTLLSACAHAGMVNEGREIYESIRRDYGLVPGTAHHVCMVDLLGRAGLLNKAFDFIEEVKRPGPAIWTAILGACKMHKNYDLAVHAAEKLLALEPENPGHYVMLSNVYALAGKMDRVETVRNMMKKRRLRKHVGYSIIEIDHKTCLFSMGDKSHPETNEIYRYLDDLMRKISEAGYVPAQESVLHELEEEEREYALRYHSEKLAIAFGLLKVKDGSSIRIVKNLRMCEDCHLAIKFISTVANREIIVRDKLRFHHFKDGVCSCGDYW